MKKLFTLVAAIGMLAIYACGPSAEEKEAREKAMQDSIAASEEMKAQEDAAKAAMLADSMANAEKAQMQADSAAKAAEGK